MFLKVQDQIAIVLCYRDAIDDSLLLFDKVEADYKDHMNSRGINYKGLEHLQVLELGRLLDANYYHIFSKTDLYDMM